MSIDVEARKNALYSGSRTHGIHDHDGDDCREYVVGNCILARLVPAEDEGRRVTSLTCSPEDIEAALRRLHGPVTRDEAIVMVAAQAAADALRGARIEHFGGDTP